jgi:uncharacterized membrane protein
MADPSASPSPTAVTPVEIVPPPSFRQRLQRLLLAGLVVLAPVALTAFVLYQLFVLMDGIFAPLIVQVVGTHVPGVGLLLTLLVVLSLGWLSSKVLGRKLIRLGERLLYRIPVGSSIYTATKSVLEVLARRQADAFRRVVLIEYPRRGCYSLAFVTATAHWASIRPDLADARTVFLPTTPNPTSGYLLVLPRDQIVDLPFSVEEGVRMVISGGILGPEVDPPSPGAS